MSIHFVCWVVSKKYQTLFSVASWNISERVLWWNPSVWPLKWKLSNSNFPWYCLFLQFYKMKFDTFLWFWTKAILRGPKWWYSSIYTELEKVTFWKRQELLSWMFICKWQDSLLLKKQKQKENRNISYFLLMNYLKPTTHNGNRALFPLCKWVQLSATFSCLNEFVLIFRNEFLPYCTYSCRLKKTGYL